MMINVGSTIDGVGGIGDIGDSDSDVNRRMLRDDGGKHEMRSIGTIGGEVR